MTDKELGRALLAADAAATAAAPDPRALTCAIVDGDRRRVRLLAGLATACWVVAAASVAWLIGLYFLQIAPRLRAYGAGRAQLQNDWDAWATVGEWAAWSVLACVTAVVLAAVSTVLLILVSRRATLRQINAGLLGISERLERLRADPAGAAPPGARPSAPGIPSGSPGAG